jgi:hypothetical protein
MRRPHTWAIWGSWGLAVFGAFVVFVGGGCGLLRRMTERDTHRAEVVKDVGAAER